MSGLLTPYLSRMFSRFGLLNPMIPLPVATRAFPESSAEWSAAFPAITVPTGIHTCQEASGSLLDKIGSIDLAPVGTPTYGNADPLGRDAVGTDTGEAFRAAAAGSYDIDGSTSLSIWLRALIPDNGGTGRTLGGKRQGSGGNGYASTINPTTGYPGGIADAGASAISGTVSSDLADGGWHDYCLVIDRTAQELRIYIDDQQSTPSDITSLGTLTSTGLYSLGLITGLTNPENGTLFSYHAIWVGTALTFTEFQTLIGN